MDKILYINACVRDGSRTKRIADYLLSKLDGEVEQVNLIDIDFPKTDQEFIIWRDSFKVKGVYDAEIFDLGKQFAAADTIVIAAPYYDFSFPATLKQYFESINVLGITFCYNSAGRPEGLCKAKKLYYVTSAGGYIAFDQFGYGYVKALAENFYEIPVVKQIKAEALDMEGADVEAIIEYAYREIDHMIQEERGLSC